MPTLEITTKLGCAMACRFCPQDRQVKSFPRDAAHMLSLDDLKTALATVPRHVRIDFAGMAEPWLNPATTDMVNHVFGLGHKVAIYTTLFGMSPDDADWLIRRHGNQITPETPWLIHLPDRDGNMTGWKPSDTYARTLERFVAFRRDGAPAGFGFMTMSPDGEVADAIRPIVGDRLDGFVGISRVENLDRSAFAPGQLLASVRHEGAVLCRSTPFFDHNSMMPNGDVVLCCMDYGRRHVLGNLLRQSYAEIFAAAPMGAIRAQAMAPGGDPAALICRKCHNAVSLDLGNGAHWKIGGDTMWTVPVPVPAAPPSPRRRWWGR